MWIRIYDLCTELPQLSEKRKPIQMKKMQLTNCFGCFNYSLHYNSKLIVYISSGPIPVAFPLLPSHPNVDPISILTLAYTPLGRTLSLYSSDCSSNNSQETDDTTQNSFPSGLCSSPLHCHIPQDEADHSATYSRAQPRGRLLCARGKTDITDF